MKQHISKKARIPLYLKILAGMIAGIVIGFAALQFDKGAEIVRNWLMPWGKIFIKMLQLIAIPLVFVSLVKGVTGLQDIRKISSLGGKTIGIYIITTVIAVLLGVSAGLLVKPGNIVDKSQVAHLQEQYVETTERNRALAEENQSQGPLAFLNDIVPDNITAAMSDNTKMLHVIFFAVFFGIAALAVPRDKIKGVLEFFDSLDLIILKMVDYIIRFAPYGVAALMAGLVTDFGGNLSVFGSLAVFALTVIACMLILMFIFYPVLIKLFTKMKWTEFLKKVYPMQLFAFTTSSSAATLPVTMDTAENKLGVSNRVSSFVLPVGVTINMDGTSCYQAVSVLFIAQVLGIDLSLLQILVIIAMTVLSSIGTPGIPGGSYVILTMVLTSVGIPAEGLALILGIDRPLDMLRTAVNVTGDVTVAKIIDTAEEKDRKNI